MDSQVRKALRDASPEECYRILKRAGYTESQMEKALQEADKIPKIPGAFADVKVSLGLLSLEDARREIAQEYFENYDFGDVVGEVDGWDTAGREWTRGVYLETDGDSIRVL